MSDNQNEETDYITGEDLKFFLEDKIMLVIEEDGYVTVYHDTEGYYDEDQLRLLQWLMCVINQPSFVLVFFLYLEHWMRLLEIKLARLFKRGDQNAYPQACTEENGCS